MQRVLKPIVIAGGRTYSAWLIALAALATLGAARQELSLVLSEVTVIDGNGGHPLPHMTIVIADGRIADIFPSGQKPMPAGAEVLDVQGQWVIPGLIDSHVHLASYPGHALARMAQALRGGVTTVRDMGGDTPWLADLTETTASPAIPAPRVHFAVAVVGPELLGKPRTVAAYSGGGFSIVPWLTTVGAHTPVQRAVALVKSTGATAIKLYSDIPVAQVRALAEESRRQGLKVWGHARIYPGSPSNAVEAGVEVLSHSSLLACEAGRIGPACDHRVSGDSEPVARLFALMTERRTILEPTLVMLRHAWVAAGGHPKRGRADSIFDWGAEATRRASQAGVRIAAGTDLLVEPGASLPAIHDEMELLVNRGGLTPLEAISAATRTGAEILGVDRAFGTVEVGKQADLVILAADPTRNIRNTRLVTHVIKGGHVHTGMDVSVGGPGRTPHAPANGRVRPW